jgi:serine/threonine protein kinase
MRFVSENRRVELHGVETFKDYFEVDNVTYQALPLDEKDSTKGLGINSSVFRAVEAEAGGPPSLVLKVCNFADDSNGKTPVARRERFRREIRALQLSLEHGKENLVVRLKGVGKVRVSWMFRERTRERTHQCFLMEPAELNLGEYLEKEKEISLQQRLSLCADLIRSVRALHEIGVYHRDIKPENVLRCDEGWKIGDLGLVGFRDDDSEAESREKIGPPRWMAPEAFNKAFCILRSNNGFIDRKLDERSDVYQLGKVCWHIIQGDIPNGCLKSKDLAAGDQTIYGNLLKPMLRYQRAERPTLSEVETQLIPILKRHSV